MAPGQIVIKGHTCPTSVRPPCRRGPTIQRLAAAARGPTHPCLKARASASASGSGTPSAQVVVSRAIDSPELADKAVETFALAFEQDPHTQYFCWESKRQDFYRIFASSLLALYPDDPQLITLGEGAAAAAIAYMYPRPRKLTTMGFLTGGGLAILTCILPWLILEGINNGDVFEAKRDKYVKRYGPLLYVPVLGVRPDCQGHGLGSLLLSSIVQRADDAGLPVYIEATTQQTADWYMRFGFELLEFWSYKPSAPATYMLIRPAQQQQHPVALQEAPGHATAAAVAGSSAAAAAATTLPRRKLTRFAAACQQRAAQRREERRQRLIAADGADPGVELWGAYINWPLTGAYDGTDPAAAERLWEPFLPTIEMLEATPPLAAVGPGRVVDSTGGDDDSAGHGGENGGGGGDMAGVTATGSNMAGAGGVSVVAAAGYAAAQGGEARSQDGGSGSGHGEDGDMPASSSSSSGRSVWPSLSWGGFGIAAAEGGAGDGDSGSSSNSGGSWLSGWGWGGFAGGDSKWLEFGEGTAHSGGDGGFDADGGGADCGGGD